MSNEAENINTGNSFGSSVSVLIIGNSGTGKSTSIRNLDPKETFIINVVGKPLPFKGSSGYTKYSKTDNPKGNVFQSRDIEHIIKCIDHVEQNMPHVKNLIIDDVQYLQVMTFFDKIKTKGYDKYNDLAEIVYKLYKRIIEVKRNDLFIVVLSHLDEEKTNNGSSELRVKPKSVGKMLDNYLTIEGLFTICLMSTVEMSKPSSSEKSKPVYSFITQNMGNSVCKSPMEMFEDIQIPNDLLLVKKKIQEYYS